MVRSRIGYWIGAGLIAAGVLGAITWSGVIADRMIDKIARFEHVPIPGSGQVRLEQHKYVIYVEGPGADDSTPAVQIAVTDARTEAPVAVAGYDTSLTYSFHTSGAAVATVTAPRAGSYRVRTDGPPGYRLVIGESLSRDLVRVGGGMVVIGGGGVVGGVVLLIVTGVRRSRPPASAGA
jgi:uncharacterized protein GlcG (DUF336 family)